MSIKAPFGEKKEKILAPQGNHVARCYNLIHIGHVLVEYNGEQKEQDKVRIGFELPTVKHEFDGEKKPMVISKEYTLSMHEKANMRKLVEGILGQGLLDQDAESFEVEDLIGKTCLLYIKHDTNQRGDKYATIVSASPVPEGMPIPEPYNQPNILNYTDKWDQEKFDKLPDFLKDKMRGSNEYMKKFGKHHMDIEVNEDGTINPEDVPF